MRPPSRHAFGLSQSGREQNDLELSLRMDAPGRIVAAWSVTTIKFLPVE